MEYAAHRLLSAILAFLVLSFSPAAAGAAVTVTDESSLRQGLTDPANSGETIILSPSGLELPLTTGIDATGGPSGYILDGNGGIIYGNNSDYIINSSGNAVEGLARIEMNDGTSSAPGLAGGFTAQSIGRSGFVGTTFRRNVGAGDGGGAFIDGDFGAAGGTNAGIRSDVHFDRNSAAGSGGGIAVNGDFFGGLLGINGDVHFDYNQALAGDGGGMYVAGSFTGDITATYFADNTASGSGGGLYVGTNFNGNISTYSFILQNQAAEGGGVYVAGTLSGDVAGATVTGNKALGGSGGGLWLNGITGSVNGNFQTNQAALDGGALYVATGPMASLSGSFVSNTAGRDGGAVFTAGNIGSSSSTGISGTFTDNRAGGSGGPSMPPTFWGVCKTLLSAEIPPQAMAERYT